MEKIKLFLKENGFIVLTCLVLFLMMQTCRQNSKISDMKRQETKVLRTNDSLVHVIKSNSDSIAKEIRKEIKLEGLRSESRMIQATDRKILDVNRQSDIEKEINILNKQ